MKKYQENINYPQRSRSRSRTRDHNRERSRSKSRNRNEKKVHYSQVDEVKPAQEDSLEDHFEQITFGSITISNINTQENDTKKDPLTSLKISLPHYKQRQTVLHAKIGAQGNILPLRLYKQMYPKNIDANGIPKQEVLQTCATSLTAYGGGNIPHFGTCEIVCEVEGLKSKELFYVTKVNGPAIIGYETSKELGLITINCSVITNEQTGNKYQSSVIYDKKDMTAKYPSCFNGIGKFQGQYKITLDPHVSPVVHPPGESHIG